MSKFYLTDQNNSGGYYIINNDVSVYVIVEADSAKDAKTHLRAITENYSNFCPCCGERWWINLDEDDGNEVPSVYGEPIEKTECDAIVYYLDDTKVKYVDGVKEVLIMDIDKIMDLFKKSMKIKDYMIVYNKKNGIHKQNNALQDYAYNLRKELELTHSIFADTLENNLGSQFVEESLKATLQFVIDKGKYVEETVGDEEDEH